MKSSRLWLSLLLALLCGATGALAQARGTISGQVVDDATNQPLSNVQIFIPGTSLGTLTNAEGRFTIQNVPAGTQVVNANRLGYSSGRQEVSVSTGQTASANFRLTASAVALDEIVVTGTAGAVQRRAQPAVVASVDAAEVIERGVVSSVQDVLTARVPGVSLTASSGSSGTAQQIRIRGASSISLSNDPLIFIDGVKADSRTQANINVGGQGTSRIFDLNPEDIESIEVVKGPAAATLYGADASAGVIQIITKRGRMGSNRFTQNISLEYNEIDPHFTPYSNFGLCTQARITSGIQACAGQSPLTIVSDNPLQRTGAFRNGNLRSLGYSARGGGENYGYYASLGYDQEEGTLPNNEFGRRTGRFNFNFVPTPTLSFDAGVALYYTDADYPINDNNIYGFLGGGYLGSPLTLGTPREGFYAPNRQVEAISSIQSTVETLRFNPVVQVNFTPREWFSNRLIIGADVSRGELTQFYPKNDNGWYTGDLNTGDLEEDRVNNDIYTIDYLGTVKSQFGESVTSNLSFGVQLIDEIFDRVEGSGTGFVTNTNRVIGAAAQIAAEQEFDESRSIGLLGQWDVGLNDRLFLQLGARLDQNSSFGENADPFFLPKVGVSYVISEEGFWDPVAGLFPSLRLRAAYGTTGRSPTPGASLETYRAQPYAIVSGGSAAGVIPLNPGNFDLKPERGTEFEAGLDAGFLSDRFGLELTYFNKKTTDLLLQVPIPPSSGFIEPSADAFPFRNIGEVVNRGLEYALRGTLVQTPRFTWDARVAGSTLHNELTDLGGVAPFGTTYRFEEGYQLGAFFTRPILEYVTQPGDARCGGSAACAIVADDREFIGNILPTHEGNVGTTVTFFQVLQLTGQVDWKGGHYIENLTEVYRTNVFGNSQIAVECAAATTRSQECLRSLGPYYQQDGTAVSYSQVQESNLEPADFVRLREVAATLSLPADYARMLRASAASLTVGGRNLALWSDYSGKDPEVLAQATRNVGSNTFQRQDFLTVPQPRRWVVRLNLSF